MRAFVVAVLGAVLVAGCDLGRGDGKEAAPPSPPTTTAARADRDQTRRCGPWTRCPEAAWVRRIARTAGYRITGETGSALVASGRGDTFYFWTTRLERPAATLAADENWEELGRVGGVTIYGDRRRWRWWVAQGYVFWVKDGPRETSTAPDPDELEAVVAASLRLRPPR